MLRLAHAGRMTPQASLHTKLEPMAPRLTATATRPATALASLWAECAHAMRRGSELQMAVELQMFSQLTIPCSR